MRTLENVLVLAAFVTLGTCGFWWLGTLMGVWFRPSQTTWHGPIEPNPFRNLRHQALFGVLGALSVLVILAIPR